MYLSAAPQCPFPDSFVGNALCQQSSMPIQCWQHQLPHKFMGKMDCVDKWREHIYRVTGGFYGGR